jgi:formylmethanofuran dehydrogenase subunit B
MITITCPFCSTLCDDVEVTIEDNEIKGVNNACRIGSRRFFLANENRITKAFMKENGTLKEVDIDTAIGETARILVESKKPLLLGIGCEAHSTGIALAKEVGAMIDCTKVVTPSSTLEEIRDKADLVVYWGLNPLHSHPRHLSRYTIFPRGRFKKRGRLDRELVVIDVRKTDTAKIADKFIQVNPNEDYELISALRAIINGREIQHDEVAGINREEIYELAKVMKSCQFGVVFFGLEKAIVDSASYLVEDLNAHTNFTMMDMGASNTGSSLVKDYSKSKLKETTVNGVLQRGEVDSALIFASDPVATFPRRSVEHLVKIPLIAIESHRTLTTELSEVVIPSTITGVENEGTGYRMDGVQVKLSRVIDKPEGVPSGAEILEMLIKRVREMK